MFIKYKTKRHIPEVNIYEGGKYWLRYYFFKYTPRFLHEKILAYFFTRRFKRKIDLKNPKTLYEKLNYLKLYDLSEKKIMLSDRLLAKEYVKKNIPELNVAKTFQVANSFKELDFSQCPEYFIIKTNHACKSGIFIENKNEITPTDYKLLAKYYDKVQKINYAYWGVFELQYKDIIPKVYVEEFLSYDIGVVFKEYEVFCFNGNPIFVNIDGPNGAGFYDSEWNSVEYSIYVMPNRIETPTPVNKEKIIEYAKKISQGFSFIRVDFFEVNGILYFAEATFTPLMGNIVLSPYEYNTILGDKLDISSVMNSKRKKYEGK